MNAGRTRGATTTVGVATLTALVTTLMTGCGALDAGTSPRSSLTDGQAQSDALLERVIANDGPGCASAVSIEGDRAWSGEAGLADVDAGLAIDATTQFDIASVSKQFTGLAVLRLAEAGALSTADTVASTLDLDASWAESVTIDDLLHHTSGVPDYTELLVDAGFDIDDTTDQSDALDVIADTELEFEPGDQFSYSNSNYVLLASIVEHVTETDFGTVLAREVFPGTSMRLDPASADARVARSYSGDDELRSEWLQVGDGSVVATAEDLAEWGAVYANSTDPAVRAMTDNAVDDGAGERYGAGIGIDTDGNLFHSGGWVGFVSLFWVSSDRSTVMSLLCNSTDLDVELIAAGLLTIWE